MKAPGGVPRPIRIVALGVGLAVVQLLGGCDRSVPPAPQASAPASQASAPAPPATVERKAEAAAPARRAPSAWPFLDAVATATGGGDFDPAAVMTRNYYFVLDASGSMNDRKCSGAARKIDVAKRALEQFVGEVPADANLGGLVFNAQGVRELLPLGPRDPSRFRRAVTGVTAGGNTPLAQAIRNAYRALTERAVAQLGYGEYHLIVVTDGEATGENPRAVVDLLIAQSPVILHTIGFCIGSSHSLNQPGRTIYVAADSPQQLSQGLQDVLAESAAFNVVKFK